MIGAIIGDVVGSRFEFNNIKTKDFKLIDEDCSFTDDTVLTIAVMDWMLNSKKHTEKDAVKYLQRWAQRHPNAGYGGGFIHWKDEEDPKPYNSCGNGAAMRISAVGFLCDDLKDVIKYSDIVTGVTHNHPEGLKGARVVATMIYLARTGAGMDKLKEYAEEEYPEIKTLDYEELRKSYFHGKEICQVTVPQAIYCFLISTDFEDCLRTTISIGGDCDTTAAISCAIAEAYYKEIPNDLIEKVEALLDPCMLDILDAAEKEYTQCDYKDERYLVTVYHGEKYEEYYVNHSKNPRELAETAVYRHVINYLYGDSDDCTFDECIIDKNIHYLYSYLEWNYRQGGKFLPDKDDKILTNCIGAVRTNSMETLAIVLKRFNEYFKRYYNSDVEFLLFSSLDVVKEYMRLQGEDPNKVTDDYEGSIEKKKVNNDSEELKMLKRFDELEELLSRLSISDENYESYKEEYIRLRRKLHEMGNNVEGIQFSKIYINYKED